MTGDNEDAGALLASIPEDNRELLQNVSSVIEDLPPSSITEHMFPKGTSTKEKEAHEACNAYLAEREFISDDLIRDSESTTLVIEVGESKLRTRGELSQHELGQLEKVLKDIVDKTESMSSRVTDNTARLINKSREVTSQVEEWKKLSTRVRKRLAF